MKKIIKITIAIILLLFIGYIILIGTRAPANQVSIDYTQIATKNKMLINLRLSNLFEPIKKGEKVIITVIFDTTRVKNVNIPNVGTATKKQLKEGKCSFTVKPEKTTKYLLEYKAKIHESMPTKDDNLPFEIVVVDEKGNKIE